MVSMDLMPCWFVYCHNLIEGREGGDSHVKGRDILSSRLKV